MPILILVKGKGGRNIVSITGPRPGLKTMTAMYTKNCPIRIYESMRYFAQPLLCCWNSLAILIRPTIGAESSSRLCRCLIRTRTDSYKLYWLFRSSEVSTSCSHVFLLHLCRTLLCTKSIMNSSQMIDIRSGPGIYSRAPYPTGIGSGPSVGF
jgi:hypothetical protein